MGKMQQPQDQESPNYDRALDLSCKVIKADKCWGIEIGNENANDGIGYILLNDRDLKGPHHLLLFMFLLRLSLFSQNWL